MIRNNTFKGGGGGDEKFAFLKYRLSEFSSTKRVV